MKPKVSEESTTGGSATFTPGTGEQYTAAPHIPNRKSRAIDYKQLFEDSSEPIYKDWDEFVNPHYIIVHLKDGRKLQIKRKAGRGGDKVYHAILQAFRDDRYDITNPVVAKMISNLDGTSSIEEQLNENYSKFKNETGKRSASEQLHKASKAIKHKLEEVSKLIEYTNQLRSEISESSGEVKYMKHTERTLEQISEMIKQIYIKTKKLK